jgi:hypothetical protein
VKTAAVAAAGLLLVVGLGVVLVVCEGVEDLVGDHAAGEAERGATERAGDHAAHARSVAVAVLVVSVAVVLVLVAAAVAVCGFAVSAAVSVSGRMPWCAIGRGSTVSGLVRRVSAVVDRLVRHVVALVAFGRLTHPGVDLRGPVPAFGLAVGDRVSGERVVPAGEQAAVLVELSTISTAAGVATNVSSTSRTVCAYCGAAKNSISW